MNRFLLVVMALIPVSLAGAPAAKPEASWLTGNTNQKLEQLAKHHRGFDMAMVETGYRYSEVFFAAQEPFAGSLELRARQPQVFPTTFSPARANRVICAEAVEPLYRYLVGIHLAAIVITGWLWLTVILRPETPLKRYVRDVRAVHFGSLFLAPLLLGLGLAFERLHVTAASQAVFPIGLGALVLFAGIAYLFPKPPDLDPFYYWTRGTPLVLTVIGLVALSAALIWTAIVLVFPFATWFG